jgi:hypothetical protein
MSWWKSQIVAALVGLYPARWKREYGAELRDVLLRRRLDTAGATNAAWHGLLQQARCGEPWVIVGAPWLVLHLTTLVWGLRQTGACQVALSTSPAGLLVGVLAPALVGYWTVARDPAAGRGGRAAMKNSLLIVWPICAVALLNGMGVLPVAVLSGRSSSWFGLFALPWLQLPFIGALGWLGGRAARQAARLRRRGA